MLLTLRRRGDGGVADETSYVLPEEDWLTVERAVAWIRERAGEAWGRAVPVIAVSVVQDPSSAGAAKVTDDVADVLGVVAAAARYDTGEGLYDEDCPQLARAGIARG